MDKHDKNRQKPLSRETDQRESARKQDHVVRNTIEPITAGNQKIKEGDAGFDTETSGLNEPVPDLRATRKKKDRES